MQIPASYVLDSAAAQAFARLEAAAHEAATSPFNDRKHPSPAQFQAVNWKHGWFDLRPGLRTKIENARGTIRSGKTPDGTPWENRMGAHYGDIVGTRGADGDQVDIFIGPFPESPFVWVINQRQNWKGARGFDEHKVMAGFMTEEQARAAYLGSYQRGWDGLESIVPCTYEQLKWWLRYGDCTAPFTTENLPQKGTPIMDQVRWDEDANPVGIKMHELLYDLRRADAGAGLLLDATTMADLMTDPDIECTVTLDALVVEVSRMSLKMDMLKKVMTATGAAVKPTDVTISDPVRARGVLQVMVIFQMDDGQTISIWFHNPDTTPAKLTPLDELISWKWMLNKRDVTIVVAPERGQELNIREVARRVMRLVERNSDAFKRANTKAQERAKLEQDLITECTVLETELADWQRKIEVAQMERDEAPTPKERWDSARGHVNAVNKAVRQEMVDGQFPQDPAALGDITRMLGELRDLANGTTPVDTPEALRAKGDELAIAIRARAEEAAKVAPAPVAEPENPVVVNVASGNRDTVLAGLGVPMDVISAMQDDGGYEVIVGSERLSLKWQDTLDSALGQRVVDVRNALREVGWSGGGTELSKTIDGSVYGIKHDVKQVGAGKNVVQVFWLANGERIVDDLTLKAPEMAALLDDKVRSGIAAAQAQIAAEAAPAPAAPAFVFPEQPDPVAFDLSTTDYEAAKAIQAEADAQQKRYAEPLAAAPKGPTGLTSDEVKATPEWKRAYAQQQAAFEELRRVNAWFAENFSDARRAERDADRASASDEAKLTAAYTAGMSSVGRGLSEDPNEDPEFQALLAPMNLTRVPLGTKIAMEWSRGRLVGVEEADAAAAKAAGGSPTDAELQAAAEAGAEVNRISRNLADLKGTEGLPKATLSGGTAATIFLYTDSDVARAVKAVHDAEELSHFKPFDPSTLKMPTAVQLGLNRLNGLVLPVSDKDKSVVLDGWSNGHMMDLTQRPALVNKAIEKYFVDTASGSIRRVPMSAVEKIEAQAKSRSTRVEPIAHFDFEEVENTSSSKPNQRIPRNSLVLESADGATWVWVDERYVAYFWKTYKGCEFFADGPDASVAVRFHGKLVGIIMPRSTKGDTSILTRAKRVKAKAQAAKSPDELSAAAVDAAYVFAEATDAFKIAVAHSVNEKDYSPFATARAMDERAKALGLSIAWDVQSVVLDGVPQQTFFPHEAGELFDARRERVLDALAAAALPYLRSAALLDAVYPGEPALAPSPEGALVEGAGVVSTAHFNEVAAQPWPTSWLDFKVVDQAFVDDKGASALPAANPLAGPVWIGLNDSEGVPLLVAGRVVGISFTSNKVRYSVAVPIAPQPRQGVTLYAVLHDVDSSLVQPIPQNDAAPALDAVGEEHAQALRAVGKGAPCIPVLDFAGDVSAAIVQLQIALDAATNNGPIWRAEGNAAQADLCDRNAAQFRNAIHFLSAGGEILDGVKVKDPLMVRITSGGKQIGTMTPAEFMKSAKAPSSMFLPDAIKQFNAWKEKNGEPERAESFLVGGKKILDDASDAVGGEEWETVVGTIKRGGEVIGRAVVADGDGKAMVYVGPAGQQRVTYVSTVDGARRNAMWSDDDAGEMLDWLLENLTFAEQQAQAAIAAAQAAAAAPAAETAPAEPAATTGGGEPPAEPPAAAPVADEPQEPASLAEGRAALDQIASFMPAFQRRFIKSAMVGEEGQYFIDKMIEMRDLIVGMPKVYEQDGKGDAAVAYLHYFIGSIDAWITERDIDLSDQQQAFGLQDLGHGPNLGYISIDEITSAGAELDLHWTPKTVGALRGETPEASEEQPAATPEPAPEPAPPQDQEGAPMDAPKVLYRSVSPREWDDILKTGEVRGGLNKFNPFDPRRLVFFGDALTAKLIYQGEEVTRQAEFEVGQTGGSLQKQYEELLAKMRDLEERRASAQPGTPLRRDIDKDLTALSREKTELEKKGREAIAATSKILREANAQRGYTAVVLQTKPISGGVVYTGKHSGMGAEAEYGFESGAVKLSDIDKVFFIKDGSILRESTPSEARQTEEVPTEQNAPMNQLRPLAPQTPDRAEWEGEIARIMGETLEVTNSDAQAMMEARPDDLDAAFAAGEQPAQVVARLWPAQADESAPDVMEQYIKIAADSIAELRKVDVDRVLGSVRADNIDGVTREALAAWISEKRPDLAAEVAEVMAELAQATAPAADPAKDADRAYLQTLADGSADYFDEGILARIEPMFEKYAGDAEMMDLLTRAANAYSEAAAAAAKQALGG